MLTTINASDNSSFTSGSQTFDGVATVTLEGNYLTNGGSYMGWYCQGSHLTATVTVNPVDGYTIDSVKFYCQNGNSSAMDTEAPFMATVVTGQGSSDIQSYLNGIAIGYNGITKIEVYTTGAGTANVIASSTPNTYYIDYGTPVTVVATPDAQHYLVSFSDDAPATERNSNLAVEKRYDSVIADIIDLTANFQAKPTLTLTANDGGTLTLDGYSPDATTYNITIEGGNTYTNVTFPFQTTVFLHEGLYDVGSGQYPLSAVRVGDNADITISEPYDGDRSVSYMYIDNENFISGHKNISCQSVESAPIMPAGVVSANATLDTFVVDYGTEVTVVAKPDSIHYLATLGGVTVGSNTAKDTTFAVTATTNFEANFAQKPTLTLAHNDGGEMEIMPEEVMAVSEFTVPSSWSGDNSLIAPTDLPSDFLPVSEAEARTWQNTTGHEVFLFFKSLASGSTAAYVRFNANGTIADISINAKSTIYNNVYDGSLVRYTTAGYASNAIASTTEPNTYYIDYNTSVTVKATPSDTTYLVRFDQDDDTNSNVAVEKTYGPLTAALTTATATFNAKPVLTLAANDTTWGKVTLGGYSPVGLGTEQLSVPSGWNDDWDYVLVSEMPTDFQTVDYLVARTWQNTTGKNVFLIFDEDEGQVSTTAPR